MVEKVLHGVNVAACCGQLVTQAIDVASAGGIATAASAALSALALKPSARPKMERDCLTALSEHLKAAALHADIEKQIVLMLDGFLPGRTDFARGNMDAARIASQMRARVLAESKVPEYRETDVLNAFEALLRATLGPLLAPRSQLEATDAELLRRTQLLLDKAEQTGKTDALREEGITEKAIIRLAQRISAQTDDVGQAWLDLQNAMDIAVRVQAEGHTPTNHGDFVDVVLARVADMAAQGDYGDANAAIEAALADADAAKAKLYESGINVAKLAGDFEQAANLLVAQADHAAGGIAEYGVLRSLRYEYFERGRDKGVTQDCELAIALANLGVERARTSEARGSALDDLGEALLTLGDRDRSISRLESAISVFQNASHEWAHDGNTFKWAGTQMLLGNALATLGGRIDSTKILEDATKAYRRALEVQNREQAPKEWAKTQMNLGNALLQIGMLQNSIDELYAAEKAYRNALSVWTLDDDPLDWPGANTNLGNLLKTLGNRESGTDKLFDAVSAHENALLGWTRDKVPMQWATAQMNLGNALQALGKREGGTDRLYAAVDAYKNCLKEWTREKVPLDWALAWMNRGNALSLLGERESGIGNFERAADAYENALSEYEKEIVPTQWAGLQLNLGSLYTAFFEKTGEKTHLETATKHLNAAYEVFSSVGTVHELWMVRDQIKRVKTLKRGL